MAYDYPYRVEYDPKGDKEHYNVLRVGEGVICEGTNLAELRRLIEAANEIAGIKDEHR
jgi:hypothetical protein